MQKALPYLICGGIASYLLIVAHGNLIDAIGTAVLSVLFFGAIGLIAMIFLDR